MPSEAEQEVWPPAPKSPNINAPSSSLLISEKQSGRIRWGILIGFVLYWVCVVAWGTIDFNYQEHILGPDTSKWYKESGPPTVWGDIYQFLRTYVINNLASVVLFLILRRRMVRLAYGVLIGTLIGTLIFAIFAPGV